MRLVMIDNYDSFTYNLVQLFSEFDLEVLVFRHDEIDLAGIAALAPDWLCISPGPKAPDQAGISKTVIAHFYQQIPILGVCLGHQALNEVFGGATVKAPDPGARQAPPGFSYGAGASSRVCRRLSGPPAIIPSWRSSNSPELEVTAWTEDGVIMGLQHRRFPLHGVQFHPESFLTSHGHALAANFLEERKLGEGARAEGPYPLPQPLQGAGRGV